MRRGQEHALVHGLNMEEDRTHVESTERNYDKFKALLGRIDHETNNDLSLAALYYILQH